MILCHRTPQNRKKTASSGTARWRGVETRGDYLALKGQQCSELFCFFLELHTRGSAEDEQAIDFPCFLLCWVFLMIWRGKIQSATTKVGMVSP